MNDPETSAEPPAPAPASAPNGGGIPGLGGLDLIVNWAIKADPTVRYAVAALGVVAVGAIAIKIVPSIAGLGALQSVLILFAAMIALMVVFVLVAKFVRGDDPIFIWVGRLLSIFMVLTFLGLICWVGLVGLRGKPCGDARRLGFAPAEECPGGKITVTPLAVDSAAPARLIGTVIDESDISELMQEAKVVARRSGRTLPTKTLSTGDFAIPLLAEDVGREFSAFASRNCYLRSGVQRLVIQKGDNELDMPLLRDPSCSTPAPDSKALKVEQVRVNVAQLAATEKITVGTSTAALKLPDPTESSVIAQWFDGQQWKYDIFYCQQPDGDPERSKQLAVQLKEVLSAQRNIARVSIKLWPSRSERMGTWVPQGPVTLNVRPERGTVAESLQRLWTPYLATGERVVQRPVTTSFPNYMSIIACRR